jgi:16S rRNA (guanine966-N2)-methyltransferase
MRIIAGKWRGRTITAPSGQRTRPVLDRSKAILFDILGHELAEPGRLPPIAVLDLFAGSGALGMEALSRGAAFCLFVEKHPRTAGLIRRNIDSIVACEQSRVIQSAVDKCIFPAPPEDSGAKTYKLIFLDPPYRMLSEIEPHPEVRSVLNRLNSDPLIDPQALVVVRHGLQGGAEPDLHPLIEYRRRDMGTMALRIMRPGHAATEAP